MILDLRDRRVRRAFYAGLALIAAFILLYWKPVNEAVTGNVVVWAYDLTAIGLALVGAILSFTLYQTFEKGEVLRAIWGGLALGLLLWAIGEALWAYYELIVGGDIYPSPADIAWVIGYIPLAAALWMRYRSLRVEPERNRVMAAIAIFVALVGLAGWFVFVPILQDTESSGVEKFVSILYPVGDLMVAFMALMIVLVLSGGELSRPWAIIAAGFFVVSVADLFFTYADWQGLYATGAESNLISALVDIPYLASYVVIAFGLYLQARLQDVI